MPYISITPATSTAAYILLEAGNGGGNEGLIAAGGSTSSYAGLSLRTGNGVASTLTRLSISNGAAEAIMLLANQKINFGTGYPTQTTVGAAGAASALPANPDGYIRVQVAGAEKVVPYYAQA